MSLTHVSRRSLFALAAALTVAAPGLALAQALGSVVGPALAMKTAGAVAGAAAGRRPDCSGDGGCGGVAWKPARVTARLSSGLRTAPPPRRSTCV